MKDESAKAMVGDGEHVPVENEIHWQAELAEVAVAGKNGPKKPRVRRDMLAAHAWNKGTLAARDARDELNAGNFAEALRHIREAHTSAEWALWQAAGLRATFATEGIHKMVGELKADVDRIYEEIGARL